MAENVLTAMRRFRAAWDAALNQGAEQNMPNPCDYVCGNGDCNNDGCCDCDQCFEYYVALINMRFDLAKKYGKPYHFAQENHKISKGFMRSPRYQSAPELIDLFAKDLSMRPATESGGQMEWMSRKQYLEELPADFECSLFKKLALELPERFARSYVKEQQIGKGGFGKVSKSKDVLCNRTVAIKEALDKPENEATVKAALDHESKIHSMLEHPNILPAHTRLNDELGRLQFVMRFLEVEPTQDLEKRGTFRSLKKEIERRSQTGRDINELVKIFARICESISFAHSRDIIHRDIKPDHIMVGDFGEVFVIDWGLARHLKRSCGPSPCPICENENENKIGGWGTPGYCSDEQSNNETPDPRDDVYSLGIVLKEILAGKCVEIPNGQAKVPEPSNDKHRALVAIANKACERRRKDRYANATELKDQIGRWLNHEKVENYKESHLELINRYLRKDPRYFTFFLIAALILIVIVGFYVWSLANLFRNASELTLVKPDEFPRQVQTVIARQSYDPLGRYFVNWAFQGRENLHRIKLANLMRGDESQLDDLAVIIGRDRVPSHNTPEDEDLLPEELFLIQDQVGVFLSDRPEFKERFLKSNAFGNAKSNHQLINIYSTHAYFQKEETNKQQTADLLCRAPVHEATKWIENGFSKIEADLIEPLNGMLLDEQRSSQERTAAANALAYYEKDMEKQANLMVKLAPEYARIFLDRSSNLTRTTPSDLDKFKRALLSIFKNTLENDPLESHKKAIAALALLQQGNFNPSLELLDSQLDQEARTYWIYFAYPFGVSVEQVLSILPKSSHGLATLYLALGEFQRANPNSVTLAQKQEIVPLLEKAFQDNPDSGVHSACDWALQQFYGVNEFGAYLGDRLKTLEQGGPKQPGVNERSWFVNQQGQTMVVFNPVQFDFGEKDQDKEYYQGLPLPQHRRKIDRRFAISTREITVADFEAFCKPPENSKKPISFRAMFDDQRPAHDKTTPENRKERQNYEPVTYMSWLHAAAYCNWLSKKENLDPCYPNLVAFENSHSAKMPVIPSPVQNVDSLGKNGYRLPTEAEWEFACRAGSTTQRPWGDDLAFVPKYATFHFSNRLGIFAPVGSLKPNAWGLFDMLGNAQEFCHEQTKQQLDDNQIYNNKRFDEIPWVVRGGSKEDADFILRSVYRHADSQGDTRIKGGWPDIGFRIARTLP